MRAIRTCTGFGISSIQNPVASGVVRYTLGSATLTNAVDPNCTIKLFDVPAYSQVVVTDAWVVLTEPFASGTLMHVGDTTGGDRVLRSIDLTGQTDKMDINGATLLGIPSQYKGQAVDTPATGVLTGALQVQFDAATPMAQHTEGLCELYVSFTEVYNENAGPIDDGHAIIDDTPFDGLKVDNAPLLGASAGASEFTYTGPNEGMPEAVGGIDAGSNFSVGGSPGGPIAVTDLITMLLYPYQSPAFSAFSISGVSSVIEVGTDLPLTPSFTWATSNSFNVAATSLAIADSGASDANFTDILTGLANSSPNSDHTYGTAITSAVPAQRRWSIRGEDTKGGTFSRIFTVNWGLNIYTGTSSDETLSNSFDFSTFTSALKTQATAYSTPGDESTAYQFPAATGEYKYFAVPQAWSGSGVSWEDALTSLNVGVSAVGTVDIVSNSITTTYNIFRSSNKLGAAMSIMITQG